MFRLRRPGRPGNDPQRLCLGICKFYDQTPHGRSLPTSAQTIADIQTDREMKSQAEYEYEVLTNPAIAELLLEIASEPVLKIARMERLRRKFGTSPFDAAVRLVKARQKAISKFPCSASLWLDPVRAEQATHQAVAHHKAARFQGLPVADICCGLGGDTMALAKSSPVIIAIDLDHDCLRRLQFNLNHLNLAQNVTLLKANANRPILNSNFFIHIDPDRRAKQRSGRPTFQIEEFQPNLSTLLGYMKTHPGGAIKLSPGSPFETVELEASKCNIRTEMELISLNGECKEATLWFGQLAGDTPRSATQLPSGANYRGHLSGTDLAAISTEHFGPYLFEVDSALVRSGLAASFAKSNQLQLCSTEGAYLSGTKPNLCESPWLTGFKVQEILAPDRKAVKQALNRWGWTTAVVKTRGRIQADEALKWLDQAPSGLTLETLFLWTSPHGPKCAILANRLGHDRSGQPMAFHPA